MSYFIRGHRKLTDILKVVKKLRIGKKKMQITQFFHLYRSVSVLLTVSVESMSEERNQ